jgi:hypothetical protein
MRYLTCAAVFLAALTVAVLARLVIQEPPVRERWGRGR